MIRAMTTTPAMTSISIIGLTATHDTTTVVSANSAAMMKVIQRPIIETSPPTPGMNESTAASGLKHSDRPIHIAAKPAARKAQPSSVLRDWARSNSSLAGRSPSSTNMTSVSRLLVQACSWSPCC